MTTLEARGRLDEHQQWSKWAAWVCWLLHHSEAISPLCFHITCPSARLTSANTRTSSAVLSSAANTPSTCSLRYFCIHSSQSLRYDMHDLLLYIWPNRDSVLLTAMFCCHYCVWHSNHSRQLLQSTRSLSSGWPDPLRLFLYFGKLAWLAWLAPSCSKQHGSMMENSTETARLTSLSTETHSSGWPDPLQNSLC